MGKFYVLWLICALMVCLTSVNAYSKVLEEYVNKPDPEFKYSLENTITFTGGTAYVLNVTYQTWWSHSQTPFNKWWHWVTIIRPTVVTHRTAFAMINGGSFGTRMPTSVPTEMGLIATQTQSVVVLIAQIPNQGITFENQTRTRVEDDLIAFTWRRFLETGDSNWIAQLAMVKGSCKSMDAAKAFLAQHHNTVIDKWVVSGASKRGWTTWLVGAVRHREIAAIVPIVIPVLNTKRAMQHIYRSYCFWPHSLRDYVHEKITSLMYTQMMKNLTDIVDPIQYKSVLTMPKFIVSATGDQFFAPDTVDFFYSSLQGETHVRDIPNADHSLRNTDAMLSIVAFYHSILNNVPRPQFEWVNRFGDDHAILTVQSKDKPLSVKLFQAENLRARDFRVEAVGTIWKSSDLQEIQPGMYQVKIQNPPSGYRAFNIELRFQSRTITPSVFSTSTYITPNRLPCTQP
jgi:PhoPQ-activated pathogenicity-related protein